MSFKQFLKKMGSNLLAGFIGSVLGIIISVFYVLKIWVPMNIDKIGLAIIAFIPVMLILFSIIGIIIGGSLGIIIFFIIKQFRKK